MERFADFVDTFATLQNPNSFQNSSPPRERVRESPAGSQRKIKTPRKSKASRSNFMALIPHQPP
jgi:hypothetical protein